MPKYQTKWEWAFSHLFFVSCLICISLAIGLSSPGIALPLIGGLWLLSRGFCSTAGDLFKRLKELEDRLGESKSPQL